LAAILFPVFSKAREKARQTTCTSNQKQIALAVTMYIQENEETLPTIDDSILGTVDIKGKIANCPNTTGQGYVFNGVLSEQGLGSINEPTMVWLSADAKKGATEFAAFSTSDMEARHAGGIIASYLDGHVVYSKKAAEIMQSMSYNVASNTATNASYAAATKTFTTSDVNASFGYVPADRDAYVAHLVLSTQEYGNFAGNTNEPRDTIKVEPQPNDTLIMGAPLGITLKGFAATLASGDSVVMTVKLKAIGVQLNGSAFQNDIVLDTYTETFTASVAAKDINLMPSYAVTNFAEIRDATGNGWYGTVIYPEVTFTSTKSGTTVKVDGIYINQYGKK